MKMKYKYIQCPNCLGHGGEFNWEKQEFRYCKRCKGTGFIRDYTPDLTPFTEEQK